MLHGFAPFPEFAPSAVKAAMCLHHRPGVTGFSLQQKKDTCCSIQQHPFENDRKELSARQILEEYKEIVSEVQIGLPRIEIAQGAAAHVEDHRRAHITDTMPHSVKAPAEIDLLEMGKEDRIQLSGRYKERPAHGQAGATGPKDRLGVVVLSMIFFEFLKDPAATKGIAQNIDESTGTARIFEAVTLFMVQDLGLDGGQLLIAFKSIHDGLQPVSLTSTSEFSKTTISSSNCAIPALYPPV